MRGSSGLVCRGFRGVRTDLSWILARSAVLVKIVGFIVLFLIAAAVAAATIAYAAPIRGTEPPEGSSPTSSKESDSAKMKGPRYSSAAYDITPLSKTSIDALAIKLTPADAEVILAKGTERAFCGNLLDNKKEGVYLCKLCGLPLFSSKAKFNSGTGWPSFFQPFDKDHVAVHSDTSHGMVRDEILCARCGGHLGHVFNDGPEPTGLRFCLNSASLNFHEDGTPLPAESQPIATQTAYFAGGCFWGVEDRFAQLTGVIDAASGYMGGKTENPTYKQVCYQNTGHAEVVRILFDPTKITYAQLLEKFFKFHDGTQLNRQGPDVGDQYRSAIFCTDEVQVAAAKEFIATLSKADKYKTRPIVTQVETVAKAGKFYMAEEYHQDYHAKNGGHCALPPE
ncbi:MAG: bifunctional methionine sulfoxide reductase B/A protein [Planctomycetota bacterium]|nr:bifunctional methionine sulfoxide reductase B/A protein [Planctomycetota bacterium]